MSPACGGAAANASPAATGSPRRRHAPPRIRQSLAAQSSAA